MSKPLTMVAVSGTGGLQDARGELPCADAKQPVQLLPGAGGVAQDVPAVLREPFGAPFADDDPGHDAAQDQVGQQGELGGDERGNGVVAGNQVERGGQEVAVGAGPVAEQVGGGDGDVVDQRGDDHVAEVDDAGHPGAVGRDQRVVRAEVVVQHLGALGGQLGRGLGGEAVQLGLDEGGAGTGGTFGGQGAELG